MKRIYKILIGIVVLVVVVIGGSFVAYNQSIKSVTSKDEPVVFSVVEGMSHQDVLDGLDEAGLVKSKFFASLFLKMNSYPIIQVNTYQLNKNMDLKNIYDVISTGSYEYLIKEGFTVPEGLTIPQIAEVLAEKLRMGKEAVIDVWKDETYLNTLIEKYDFLSSDILNPSILYPLEGYLYPETYNTVGIEQTVEAYTELMLDMMDSVITPYKAQISAMNMSVHQFLTFTSIVERESLFEEDKAKIAGVFMNRLDIDMMLQSDITVLYALQRTGLDITYDELETDSLYNTYKYTGLPVGPVSSVYKGTIEACLNPVEHDYIFFFATKDGDVLYSKTLEEHDKTVEENMWY